MTPMRAEFEAWSRAMATEREAIAEFLACEDQHNALLKEKTDILNHHGGDLDTWGARESAWRDRRSAALTALRQAMGAAPSNTDSVNSGLALTEGEPGEAPEKFILWQRRNGSRDGAGGFEWDEWAFCRREDALRVEGLHSWQIRTLIASPVAQARDSLVATASQHEKPPASGSSTAVSDTYSEYEIAGGFWDIDLPDSLCERLLIALQERRAALQASNGLGDSQPATTSTDGVREVPRG
jgi:hypothetical protein